jgi:hypothetical protein
MGTRALTFVYEGTRPIINLYRQYDGYPTGHGAELAQFLEGFKVGNGIGANTPSRYANGMGCLAAQLVANFKTEAGQFYLHSPEQKECGQDYEYHVYSKDGELRVAVTNRGCNFFGLTTSDVNESIFDGPVADFVRFCSEDEMA